MIGYGNTAVSPLKCPFNKHICRDNSVHIAHLGMCVQLDTLNLGIILTLNPEIRNRLNTSDPLDRCFLCDLKVIVFSDTTNNKEFALFYITCDKLLILFISDKEFTKDRVCEICKTEFKKIKTALGCNDVINSEHHALYYNITHIVDDILDRNDITLNGRTVNNIWILGCELFLDKFGFVKAFLTLFSISFIIFFVFISTFIFF